MQKEIYIRHVCPLLFHPLPLPSFISFFGLVSYRCLSFQKSSALSRFPKHPARRQSVTISYLVASPFFKELGNRFMIQIAGRSNSEPCTTGKDQY